MLQKLTIKNIILIAEAEIDFSAGLNVLSGETGAGKSIVIDCLMLLFGYRYDKSLLRYGCSDGFVEGVFSLSEGNRVAVDDMGFGSLDDEIVVVKRRFNSDGKSDIRINGQSATATMLKRLMILMLDIYVQHDFLRLNNQAEQLAILDYYDRHRQKGTLEILAKSCEKYREIHNSLSELGDLEERDREIDYLRFQIDEIENSGTFKGEEDAVVEKRRRALNTEKIAAALSELSNILDSAELSRGASMLGKVSDFDDDFPALCERISAAAIEIDDISESVISKIDELKSDEVDLDMLEGRLAFLRNLSKKYGDFDKMTEYAASAQKRLSMLENCGQMYEKLTAGRTKITQEIYDLSLKLSELRKRAAEIFCEKIEGELAQLGMENSRFSVVFQALPERENCEKHISKNGMDSVEFHLSSNVGQPAQPLAKIISGGEMSRFMLALKVVTGDSDKIPTLIFDEIDAGISGVVGMEVAKKLARISARSQVLCVTHLPQIAAMADTQFYVEKNLFGGETVTKITPLGKPEMVKEITRLQGGMGISKTQEQSATELKNWCDNYKKSLVNKV